MSDPEADRMRQIWCSVIALALEDATVNVDTGTERAARILQRDQARHWLTQPSRDFADVCHLAGLDPQAVREGARRLIERHDLNPRRRSRLEAFGEARTIEEWAALVNSSRSTIRRRLAAGWSLEEALTAPVRPRAPNRQRAQAA